MISRLLAAFLAGWSAPARAVPPASELLSAEELFRAELLGEARLSPDGRHIGTIVTDEKDLKDLLIVDLGDYKPLGLRGSGSLEISTFQWLTNDRVLFTVTKEKVYSWGLYSARIDRLDSPLAIDNFDAIRIVGLPDARPGRVLVWIMQSSLDEGRPGGLVELDTNRVLAPSEISRRNDALARSYSPPSDGPVVSWGSNRQGDLALCTTWSNGNYHLHRYLPSRGSWRDVVLPPGTRPMGLDYDDRFLWAVTISPANAYELRRFDLDAGTMDKPVLTDPLYDIGTGRLHFSKAGRCLAGVTYVRRKPVAVWFSRAFAVAQATVDSSRADTDNVLINHDLAESKFLFQLNGPNHPPSYELLDLDARTLRRLADAAPWLKGRPLRPVQPISFATRDGVRLEGYQALPEGADAKHPAPLVVLVHGGPWVRDVPSFDPVVQFLASRGYAVLQPNYRGSSGYAPQISHEREYDFMRMHNDVTDATRAMLRTGLVDPGRVGIMGASFGGYLAVAGVAFEKGLYRCAVTECGVFDWERQIKSKSDAARPGEYEVLVDELGRPGRDRERLRQISPLEHADQIHVPVLIAHGTEDNIVDVAQSRKLAGELKRNGVPYETFFRGLEGHGFYNYKNRVEFYHRVEAFLAANLGGATLTR
ncbi:MAG: alpha/beta fold hydrolase [Opitutaceae bacterium]